MTRYIAFLRAINVGGHTVKMTALKALFESMHFTNVETFIASGNVIFSAKEKSNSALNATIERTLGAALGYEVATFVRPLSDLGSIVTTELFTPEERDGAHGLYIGLMREPLSTRALEALTTFETSTEKFRTRDREIHFLAHISMADSKFSNAKLEKAIGTPVTFRNVTTMQRLLAKYGRA